MVVVEFGCPLVALHRTGWFGYPQRADLDCLVAADFVCNPLSSFVAIREEDFAAHLAFCGPDGDGAATTVDAVYLATVGLVVSVIATAVTDHHRPFFP